MKRNDVHDYTDGVQVRIIDDIVMVSNKDNETIASDIFHKIISGPQSRKVADLYYKKHILNTYDDLIKTPYSGYYPEYSPIPGTMVRVVKMDLGFRRISKMLVSARGAKYFKKIWVPKGQIVTQFIKEHWAA